MPVLRLLVELVGWIVVFATAVATVAIWWGVHWMRKETAGVLQGFVIRGR